MTEKRRKFSISALGPWLLLAVFGAGILAVLLTGAGAYRDLVRRDRQAYDSRTACQFLATKVRQNPHVEVTQFGDGDCLLLRETYDGVEYWTRVYCHDGWLMELFTLGGADFAPRDGEKILPAQSLTLELENGLLHADLVDDSGGSNALVLSPRSGKEATP